MRCTPFVVFVLGMMACKGKDGGVDDSDTDSTGPVAVELVGEAPVASAEIGLGEDVVTTHKVLNTLLSASALVAADEEVQARLGGDNGSRRSSHCWSRPQPAQTAFTIDYTGCEQALDTTGAVFVNDHPLGPVIFEFVSLTFGERSISGTLAFDRVGAEPLHWTTYDSVSSSPQPTNRSPIGVTMPDGTSGITWDGGASIDLGAGDWTMWGVGQVLGQAEPLTGLMGGTDPVTLMSSVSPGADAILASLDHLQCRCPIGGTQVYDMDLQITEIVVDLDDLKAADDGVDDPEIELSVDRTLVGEGLVTAIDCGEYDTTFTADEGGSVTLVVDGQSVINEIQLKCDQLVIDDEARCNALLDAAATVGDFTFTVDEATLQAGASAAVIRSFDTAWCKY